VWQSVSKATRLFYFLGPLAWSAGEQKAEPRPFEPGSSRAFATGSRLHLTASRLGSDFCGRSPMAKIWQGFGKSIENFSNENRTDFKQTSNILRIKIERKTPNGR
jgi:hypothetical protein